MHLSPLQPVSQTTSYRSGDVSIDPTAVIGSGVLLQADPQSRIIIAPGVCIGMGSIIHACGGEIKIATGVTLGAGVLVIGTSQIGANTCIGAATTIYSCDIASGEVVPPAVLLGDKSRQIPQNGVAVSQPENGIPTKEKESVSTSEAKVYGQEYLQRMMLTLLPHRRLH